MGNVCFDLSVAIVSCLVNESDGYQQLFHVLPPGEGYATQKTLENFYCPLYFAKKLYSIAFFHVSEKCTFFHRFLSYLRRARRNNQSQNFVPNAQRWSLLPFPSSTSFTFSALCLYVLVSLICEPLPTEQRKRGKGVKSVHQRKREGSDSLNAHWNKMADLKENPNSTV